MDLQQLRIFRSAATSGGFTRASEQLNLSQSTVSQHMKQLEESLGCSLFLRVGKRVYLNDAGKLLLRYTDRIFNELKNAEMAVRELNTMLRGTVRLGVGATTLIYMLPRVLSSYRRKYPEIELIVSTATTESLMQSMASQTLDLAIVMQPENQVPSVQLTPLMREELVVIVPVGHPLAAKNILQPADMRDLPLIGYFRDTTMRSVVESFYSAMMIEPVTSMELENMEAIKSLVRAGVGVSIIPLCCVQQSSESAGIRILRIQGMPMYRELFLALPRSEMIPIAIRKLEAYILKGLGVPRKPVHPLLNR